MGAKAQRSRVRGRAQVREVANLLEEGKGKGGGENGLLGHTQRKRMIVSNNFWME